MKSTYQLEAELDQPAAVMLLEALLALLILSIGILPLSQSLLRLSNLLKETDRSTLTLECKSIEQSNLGTLVECKRQGKIEGYIVSERESGSSLLELLVALSLVTGIVLLSGSTLIHTIAFRKSIDLQLEQKVNELSLSEILRKIVMCNDAASFLPLPIVHNSPDIRFSDGSLNAISLRTDSLKPAAHSSAISGLCLNPEATLIVNESIPISEGYQFIACRRWPNLEETEVVQSYLGLGVRGFTEFVGSRYRISQSSGCYKFELTPVRSMTVLNNLEDARFVNLLIPITSQFTIYLDSAGSLRYLGHRGGGNIENQPLIENLAKFDLALETQSFAPHLNVSFHFEQQSKALGLTLIGSITRTDPLNFLLTRP